MGTGPPTLLHLLSPSPSLLLAVAASQIPSRSERQCVQCSSLDSLCVWILSALVVVVFVIMTILVIVIIQLRYFVTPKRSRKSY